MTQQTAFPMAAGNIVLREIRASFVTIADDGEKAVTDPQTIADILRKQHSIHEDPQENVFAFYLDTRHNILSHELAYRGTVNSALVSVRDIARNALIQNAAAVIVAHNHPSGHASPSPQDIAFTRKLAEALRLFDVDTLDHVIIGGARHYSMQAHGHL